MKKRMLIIVIVLISSTAVYSQKKLNLNAVFNLDNMSYQGISAGIEYENYFSEDFSLPVKAEIGFIYRKDFNSFSIAIHKGFRKYFDNGFFVEQNFGLGAMANVYKTESIWYFDDYAWGYRFAPGANWGFMPSVGVGFGYNLTKNKEQTNLIWIRPNIYWNLGFRPLHLPYSSVQIGYTFNLKTY